MRNANDSAVCLIVSEIEDLILLEGSARSAAKLILLPWTASRGQVVFGIEVSVAQVLENIAVQRVRTVFGDDVDLAAGEITVLGIKVVGDDAELAEGVQIGDDGGSRECELLHGDAIEQIAVGGFSHAIDRLVAGVFVSRYCRKLEAAALEVIVGGGTAADAGVGIGNARLQRQQIGKTAAIERNRGDLLIFDDLAQLRRGRFHPQRIGGNGDHFVGLPNLQCSIDGNCVVHIQNDPGLFECLESLQIDAQFILARRQSRERVRAVSVRRNCLCDVRICVGCSDCCSRNDRPRSIFDSAQDACGHAGKRASAQPECQKKQGSRHSQPAEPHPDTEPLRVHR